MDFQRAYLHVNALVGPGSPLRKLSEENGVDSESACWTCVPGVANFLSPQDMTVSIRQIKSAAEFGALESSWNDLAAVAVDGNTFLTHTWLFSWWSAYQPRARLRILLCEDGSRLLGIAPMMVHRESNTGALFRRLRFVGDGTSETDHMNFILRSEHRQEAMSRLLVAIDELPWDIAHFNQIPESSANAEQLLDYAAKKKWFIAVRRVPCPRRVLPESNEELMAALPKRLRTAIRSARRDLETNHEVQFGSYARHEELSEALETLYRNHTGRWRAKGEEGVFVDERKRAFYAIVSQKLLESGSLRFFYLKVDGRVVAQQFCFEHSGTVMLLQEGFDFDFAKQNVGNVLRAMVFEHLIAAGSRVYDFLEGTSRHKEAWSDSAPCDLNIKVCRNSALGRVAHYLPRWVDRIKQFGRTLDEAKI